MTVRRNYLELLVLAASISGCAAAPPAGGPTRPRSETDQRLAAAEMDLERAESELSRLAAEQVVDCARACTLTATICDLSDRICALAKQNHVANLHPRCQDAMQRCQRAERNTSVKCKCEKP
jgi:hypothetical protein